MSVRKCGRDAGKLAVERVEDRLVLSAAVPQVSVTLTDGSLTIEGSDNRNENIVISEIVVKQGEGSVHELKISGTKGTHLTSGSENVTVGKNNTVVISDETAISFIDVRLGNGSNHVTVQNLKSLNGELSIGTESENSNGKNTIAITGMKAAPEGTSVVVNLGSGSSSLTVSNSTLTSLQSDMESSAKHADTVKVTGSEITDSFFVRTGSGNDHVTFANGNSHTRLDEGAEIDLGAGNDQVQVNKVFMDGLMIDGGDGQDTATGNVQFPQGAESSNLDVTSAANHIHIAFVNTP